MTKRPAVVVLLLGIVTCGLYTIFWFVDTKQEMVRKGAQIPSAGWIIVPIVNIWWTWKWAGGVAHVTRGKLSQGAAFIAVFLLNSMGSGLVQAELDKTSRALAFLGLFLLNAIGTAFVQVALNRAIDEDTSDQLPRARVV